MNPFSVSVIVACSLLSPPLLAQRGGMYGGGMSGIHPAPSLRHTTGGRPLVTGFRRERSGYAPAGYAPAGYAPWGWGSPSYYSDQGYSQACNGGSPSPQALVVGPRQGPLDPPPPSAEPVRPVTRDYTWPADTKSAAGFYALASKGGSVRYAVAVWVLGGRVHYTQTDGTGGSAPLDSIDRGATTRLNAENNLSLPLPLD